MPNDTRDNPTLDRKGFLRTGVAGVAGAVGVGAGLTVPGASAAVTTRDAEVKAAATNGGLRAWPERPQGWWRHQKPDGERLISEHRGGIDLEATPVAMDGALMRLSNGRRQTSPPSPGSDE